MTQIRIIIRDPAGAKETPVSVPNDIPLKRLIPPLVAKLSLPTGTSEHPHTYEIDQRRTGKRLRPDDTLASAGVEQGDVLTLIPQIVAGCFLAGTQISLPTGDSIPIEQLSPGDELLTFDTLRNNLSRSPIIGIFRGTTTEHMIINDRLHVTRTHIVFFDDKWEPVSQLKIGDHLRGSTGEILLVETLKTEHLPSPVPIYNLHLRDNHTFFADGILVHNAQSKALPLEPLLRITRDDIAGQPPDWDSVAKGSALVYAVIMALGAVGFWAWHGADKESLLNLVTIILCIAVMLGTSYLWVVSSRNLRTRSSPRTNLLFFMAFLILTIEAILVIVLK